MESERILGQNHILRHFENAIRMGKISHAYIINGEEGSGKMNLAIHFAKALQCERNNSNKAINEDGERIAQMVANKIEVIEFEEVSDINDGVDRGGGFGSSGKY
jgi:DNA polymerase-3 subunit delta'